MARVSKVVWLTSAIALGACGDDDGPSDDAGCRGANCEAADAAWPEEDDPSDATLDDAATAPAEAGNDAGSALDASDGMQPVTIRFKAKLGDQDLVCGQNYPGQGSTGLTATPQDFRFYVQEVRLVRKGTSQEERVQFDIQPPFQRAEVALIDFTDAKGNCGGSGGSIVNTTIRGRVPVGEYDGIVFVNGVPESLNHAGPAETAAAPLDDVTLFWNWLGGYRFVVAELLPVSAAHDAGAPDASMHDAEALDAGGAVDAASADAGDAGVADAGDGGVPPVHPTLEAAFVHIGSTGCIGTPAMGFNCIRQARNQIRLMGFNPATSSVVADLAAVFKTSDLATPPQCHGIAPACVAPYAALGVDMDSGMPSASQQVFRVE